MADATLIPSSIRDARSIALWEIIDGVLLDYSTQLPHVLDIENVVEAALPILAADFGIINALWEALPDVATKRQIVKEAILFRMRAGTPWAVKRACHYLGWDDVAIIEHMGGLQYNGAALYDGYYTYGEISSHWAVWRLAVTLGGAAWTADVHDRLSTVLPDFDPERSRFDGFRLILETHDFGAIGAPGSTLRFAVSADGVTWYPRRIRRTTETSPGVFSIEWRIFGGVDAPAGLAVTHFALLEEDDSVFADWVRDAAVVLDTDVELQGLLSYSVA